MCAGVACFSDEEIKQLRIGTCNTVNACIEECGAEVTEADKLIMNELEPLHDRYVSRGLPHTFRLFEKAISEALGDF
jgi:hypothetical protein